MEEYENTQETTKERADAPRVAKSTVFGIVLGAILAGFAGGFAASSMFAQDISAQIQERLESREEGAIEYTPQTAEEDMIIGVVEEVSPSVVSIVVTRDVPVMRGLFSDDIRTEPREIGGGTGFIVSEDGLVVTNRHVVEDEEAEYSVFTNEGVRLDAHVLARDPFQDLAVLQIEPSREANEEGNFVNRIFTPVSLGDSDSIRIGQTAIAIGNALGEFRNTVSSGVISGLGRTIVASGEGTNEVLENVIQTDTAINRGNSGGPLLNLSGEVIGINTATAKRAQNIGFAIPVNQAKRSIQQAQEDGEISYPFLGVRYVDVSPEVQGERDLSVDHGALIVGEPGRPGVTPDSAASEAGLSEGDVILEMGGTKIDEDNSLASLIRQYSPGDEVTLTVLRNGEEMSLNVTLREISG